MTVHDVDNSVYEGIISYALKYSGEVRGTKVKVFHTALRRLRMAAQARPKIRKMPLAFHWFAGR